MQIIPVNEEEAITIEKQFETSAVAQRMLFSISPLTSPKRRDSVSVNDTNLAKQVIINRLQNAVDSGEEKRERYDELQTKIAKFNLK